LLNSLSKSYASVTLGSRALGPEGIKMKRLLIIAMLLTAGLVTAIVFKLRAQTAALAGPPGGSGVIEGTDVDVASQISARVERVEVKKGQPVSQGQLLVVLDCSDVNAAIADGQARVAAAQAQTAAADASAHAAQRATGVAWVQAAAARTKGEALDTRRAIAVRNVERLVKAGEGVTAASLDQNQSEAASLALDQKAAVDTARASAAQAGVAAAQGNAAQASVRAAQAAIESAKANLQRTILLQRECEIRAPRAGIIEETYLEAGEVAARGVALLRLVDIEEVKITFYLPNAELGAITNGNAATVVADAYPGATFPGKVTSIATEAAFTPRNIQTRTDRDRLVYPVEVTLPNADHRLRPGMPAEVKLVNAH
jgi:HlyD family secretion protein